MEMPAKQLRPGGIDCRSQTLQVYCGRFGDGTAITVAFGVGLTFTVGVGLGPVLAFARTLGFGDGVGRIGVGAVFVVLFPGTAEILAFISVASGGTSPVIAPLDQILGSVSLFSSKSIAARFRLSG